MSVGISPRPPPRPSLVEGVFLCDYLRMATLKSAIVTGEFFESLVRLVKSTDSDENGPLELRDLPKIERYMRTRVLHDRVFLITDDAIESANVESIESLKHSATEGLKTGDGHSEVRSALLSGEWERALGKAEEYPAELFKDLDIQWQEYARILTSDGGGLSVPPVLSIVLTRCARRDAIVPVLNDLAEEWAGARRKVWRSLDALRDARTLGQALEIRRELSDCSKLFAPQTTAHDTRPIRVLWEIFSAGAAGLSVATLSGGSRFLGTVAGMLSQIPRSMPALLDEFGPTIFGRSAFDLARRVRRATYEIDVHALSRLLKPDEKQRLGIG